jgi:hypothetical protein
MRQNEEGAGGSNRMDYCTIVVGERDLVYMGTSALFTFRILKNLKSHTFMSPKIMALKYIGIYLQEECMQKSLIKKYVVSWEI